MIACAIISSARQILVLLRTFESILSPLLYSSFFRFFDPLVVLARNRPRDPWSDFLWPGPANRHCSCQQALVFFWQWREHISAHSRPFPWLSLPPLQPGDCQTRSESLYPSYAWLQRNAYLYCNLRVSAFRLQPPFPFSEFHWLFERPSLV